MFRSFKRYLPSGLYGRVALILVLPVVLLWLVIAFSEVTITYAWKKVVTYLVPSDWAPSSLVQLLSTDYKFAVSFSILIIVLLFRPTGL
ncbi:hypothetical protein N9C64_03295, partial [Paracoccaceae bacterium]|nr:hypothetical protein [Paracoccaceae bacterium]